MKNSLAVSFSLITAFFLVSRLPLFLYFPIPGGYLATDCFEYFKAAFEMRNGQVPLFDIRTPGYPLFLLITSWIWDSALAIIITQNILTLIASLFLTHAVFANYRGLTYGAAAAMIFYLMSNNSVEADSNLLTNSLYTNLLIIFSGILIFCLNRNKYWAWLSLCVGAIIYVRPSGLFLIPLVILIAIFLMVALRDKRAFMLLTIPAGVMLLSLSFYNLITLNKFSVSPWGGGNLAGVTITFMEEDSAYSLCENQVIAQIKNRIPVQDMSELNSDYSMGRFHIIYWDNYYLVVPFMKALIANCGYENYVGALPSIKKISYDAIGRYPEKYLTFVFTNLYHYIFHGNFEEHQLFYYSETERRYDDMYVKRRSEQDLRFNFHVPELMPVSLKKYAYKEFYSAQDSSTFENRFTALKNNLLFKLFDLYTLKINRVLLRNWFWPIALLGLFFISAVLLLTSRLSHQGALLVFVICGMNICSAIVVSLVEVSFYHYTYMTEFTYYLAVALSPVLFNRS